MYKDTVRYISGVPRLVTPAATLETKEHFDCDKDFGEYGPILDQDDGEVNSHWDAAFMQGSIMAPNIGLVSQHFHIHITFTLFNPHTDNWTTPHSLGQKIIRVMVHHEIVM